MNKQAAHYIELALREKIKANCPGYGGRVSEIVVEVSMQNAAAGVAKDTLIRAVELAAAEVEQLRAAAGVNESTAQRLLRRKVEAGELTEHWAISGNGRKVRAYRRKGE